MLDEERAAQLSRLQKVTTALAGALTSEQVAEAVIDVGTSSIGARTGALYVVASDMQTATMMRQSGIDAGLVAPFLGVSLDGDTPLGDAVRSREPVIVSYDDDYARRYPDAQRRSQHAALSSEVGVVACVPLVVADTVVGALTFGFERTRVFRAEDRFLLGLVADHTAQALQRARHYEAEQRTKAEMALLYHLIDSLNRAETIEGVSDHALDVVQRGLGVARCAMLVLDGTGVMRFRSWRGLSEPYRRAVEGHSPWPTDVKSPRPVLIADSELEPSVERFRPLFREEDIRALAFFPLVHKGRMLGKFMVYSHRPRVFTSSEVHLAESIAGQVAQAVARRKAEAEAEAARAAAEEASRMKDQFLAVVSHELRTPLAAIVGWAGILRGDRRNDPGALTKGLDVIERNARIQTKIIEDILDVSRIVTGKLVLDPRPVSLRAVVHEALDSVKASAAAKDIVVTFAEPDDPRDDDPHRVVGDPERLRQIAWNLLSNAIKFTPPRGRVDVRLWRDARGVGLQVRDTGRGIAQDFLPHVFERFRQADGSTTRRHGGLGLGLAIARHLVELHGGSVHAASDGLNKGATFTVTFPVKAVGQAQRAERTRGDSVPDIRVEEEAPPTSLDGIRVLVVDDEPDARDMLREVFSSNGAEVRAVESAAAALACMRDFRPNVLVSDIAMPDEDGFTLLKRVRELPEPLRSVPAIALTAHARADDASRALKAGFSNHLAKPADPSMLVAIVAQQRNRGGAMASP
ncbi:MAG: GAF domain-containing protein [Polyangiaceae bacterium]|nr:GAF domain-containing protein [Polyangiaceae bacterium]